MKLVIAEKPSVAKSIAAVIGAGQHKDGYEEGNGYIVSWCYGHLIGLSDPSSYGEQYKKWSYDTLPIIPENDGFNYSILPSSKEQYSVIYKLMKREDVTSLVEATDAGREGELIFRKVYLQADCRKPIERLWISSMEDDAIREGFNNLKPGRDYDNLYNAAKCREKSDWLVGINFTRLFSVKYNARLRVGRVQSPTLAMICKREDEIKNFKKTKYYLVHLKKDNLDAVSVKIMDPDKAKALALKIDKGKGTVKIADREKKSSSPPKLYDLTTLQRDANKYFSFTAQETLDRVQSLYEKKLLTYPRTDSQYLTDDMTDSARDVINAILEVMEIKKEGDSEANITRVLNSKKVSDHHAIIPTVQIKKEDLTALPEAERKILYLVSFRLLSATGEKEDYIASTLVIEAEGAEFGSYGKVIVNAGWKGYLRQLRALFGRSEDDKEDEEEKTIPEYKKGQVIEPVSGEVSEHFTSPPKHYSEDTLLSAMENAGAKEMSEDVERTGLGTPATRAGIIEKLVTDGFVTRNKKSMVPTEEGMKLIKVLPEEVKSASMTVEWENRLADMAKGIGSPDTFMEDINSFVRKVVSDYPPEDNDKAMFVKPPLFPCPNCKEGGIIKGKYGLYCDKKCGMSFGKAYGKPLTDNQWMKISNGEKVLISGFTSKNEKKYDAYLQSEGIENYQYKAKDGTEHTGMRFKLKMTFPDRSK